MSNKDNNLGIEFEDDEEENEDLKPEPKQKDPEVDIRRYRDPAGLSVAELDLGLWYVENKEKIIEVSYFVVFLLALASWAYFFYEFGTYVVKGIPESDSLLHSVLVDNLPDHSYYLEGKAIDLQLYPTKTIAGNGNKRDIISQVTNPNQDYWARFTHYFLNSNE